MSMLKYLVGGFFILLIFFIGFFDRSKQSGLIMDILVLVGLVCIFAITSIERNNKRNDEENKKI